MLRRNSVELTAAAETKRRSLTRAGHVVVWKMKRTDSRLNAQHSIADAEFVGALGVKLPGVEWPSTPFVEASRVWLHQLGDRVTEGHSQRVAALTVQLARVLGVPASEMANIRRGALLHDIGKRRVPDAILRKPGPLTEGEWISMRRHPAYALEMLAPMHYVRSALDIPYCHHEKWDGSGYPRGLEGAQIPLAARILAVADVWDALHSNRPYRRALPQDQVRGHICEQAGHHFDPAVVGAFLVLDNK
jgi:putative nucleotidyltransferase with HDIG domain